MSNVSYRWLDEVVVSIRLIHCDIETVIKSKSRPNLKASSSSHRLLNANSNLSEFSKSKFKDVSKEIPPEIMKSVENEPIIQNPTEIVNG